MHVVSTMLAWHSVRAWYAEAPILMTLHRERLELAMCGVWQVVALRFWVICRGWSTGVQVKAEAGSSAGIQAQWRANQEPTACGSDGARAAW